MRASRIFAVVFISLYPLLLAGCSNVDAPVRDQSENPGETDETEETGETKELSDISITVEQTIILDTEF